MTIIGYEQSLLTEQVRLLLSDQLKNTKMPLSTFNTIRVGSLADMILVTMIDQLGNDERYISTLLRDDKAIVLKSSLDFEHTPQIRYIIRFQDGSDNRLEGKMYINLRSTDPSLLRKFNDFLDIFIDIDEDQVKSVNPQASINYKIKDGDFQRNILTDQLSTLSDVRPLGLSIIDLILMMDDLLKQALSDDVPDREEIAELYAVSRNNQYLL